MIRLCILVLTVWTIAGGCPSSPGPTPPAPDYTGSWTDQPEWDWSGVFPDQPIPQVEPRQIPDRPQPGELSANLTPQNDLQTILNSGITWFELQPGDYTEQGRVTIETSWVNIRCDSGCILPPIRIWADNVTITGATITGMDYFCFSIGNGNTFDHCRFSASAGLRVAGNENAVQYCWFGNKPQQSPDAGGMQFIAGIGQTSRNNLLYGCEFDGVTDGPSTGWDDGQSNGFVAATTIAWNLCRADTNYTVNEYGWTVNCSENGADIKGGAGTDDIKDQSVFFGNISIGHTVTREGCSSGSYGDGLLFHRRARNWDVFGNISMRDATGFRVASYQDDPTKKDRVENINIHHNLILYPRHGFQRPDRPNPVDGLAAQVLCRNCAFTDNVIVGAAATNPINVAQGVKLENNRVLTGIPDTVKIMTAWGEIVAPAAEDGL